MVFFFFFFFFLFFRAWPFRLAKLDSVTMKNRPITEMIWVGVGPYAKDRPRRISIPTRRPGRHDPGLPVRAWGPDRHTPVRGERGRKIPRDARIRPSCQGGGVGAAGLMAYCCIGKVDLSSTYVSVCMYVCTYVI